MRVRHQGKKRVSCLNLKLTRISRGFFRLMQKSKDLTADNTPSNINPLINSKP